MTKKTLKEFQAILEDLDLPILSTESTGSGHFKIRTQHQGRSHFFVAPASASDHRAMMNFRATVKRWKETVQPVAQN